MSDEEEFLSEESYEFEFEEDEQIEDLHQNSAEEETLGLKEDSIQEAAEQFKRLIASADAEADAEWIFKAYKQLAKLHFQCQDYNSVLQDIPELMKLLPRLNGNYAEESISKILARYAVCSDQTFVKNLYDVIVSHLQNFILSGASGHRLWLKISMNRLNNLLELGDLDSCQNLIGSINLRLEATSELTRNSFALEIIAAEIELVMRTTGDPISLGILHRRSQNVALAIIHPRVMGVIKECGATVQFFKGNYDRARVEFYESFKNYDEAGSASKKKVLKNLIICYLLAESEVNPFESQETQSYAQLEEFQSLIDLVSANEKLDLRRFKQIEGEMKQKNDPILHGLIFPACKDTILQNLHFKILKNYANAYRTLWFDFAIEKLDLADDESLEQLLIEMANKGTIVDFKVNFLDRFITFDTQGMKDIIPSSLEEKSIKRNVMFLSRTSFKGPWKAKLNDSQPSESNLQDSYDDVTQLNSLAEDKSVLLNELDGPDVYEQLFGNSVLQMKASSEQEEWLNYVQSSIPKKENLASSHINQVISEQQEENDEISQETEAKDEADGEIQQGILGAAMNQKEHVAKLTGSREKKEKLELLHKWVHLLSRQF